MPRPKPISEERAIAPYERVLHTDIPFQSVSFDSEAFDALLRSQGVPLIHFEAMPCPVGLVDIGDNRRPHEDHENCSNGMVYERVGQVTVSFIGNPKNSRIEDAGIIDGSTVTVTLPRSYDDNPDKQVSVLPYDRVYLSDDTIVVPHWQRFRAHETGRERLQFPAHSVVRVKDSNGKSYDNGDFTVDKKGQIVWGESGGPPPGTICSVRYNYRPYWYVSRLLHEIRVTQSENMVGDRTVVRMPQNVVLAREFIFQNEQQNDLSPESPRKMPASEDGGFGPR